MGDAGLSIILALGVAASAGSADYLGADCTRRTSALRVAGRIQLAGLAVVGTSLLFGDPPALSPHDIWLSALAGLAIAAGLASLYRALALGPMGATAPTAAVLGAAIPVATATAGGDPLTPAQVVGLLFGLAGIALFASGPMTRGRGAGAHGLAFAILAGLGIGCFTLVIEATSPSAGLWPLALARGTAAVSLLGLARLMETVRAAGSWLSWKILVAGALDAAAMIMFLLALRMGHMALVAVLAGLYPAFTVAWATVIDRERLEVMQRAGLVAALLAIVLIST